VAEQGLADEDDPAHAICLTDDERDWLSGFLTNPQTPSSTMTFEKLHGLLTALGICPAMGFPSGYNAGIWGTGNGTGPEWDSIEQVQYFMNLVMKHWNAIAARRNAGAPHDPFILGFDDAERGQTWAKGFMVGVELGQTSWDPMFQDRRAAEIGASILAPVRAEPELFEDRVTHEIRTRATRQSSDHRRLLA